jgi:PAS domain S-box-containing protein
MTVSVYVHILVVSSLVLGVLGFYVLIKRKSLKLSSLAGLLFSIALWSFASAIEINSSTLELKHFFTIICYLGIVSIPVWYIKFAAEYSGFAYFNRFSANLLLWIIPVVSLALLITNKYHNLFYAESSLAFVNGVPYHKMSYGIWWWINFTYSYLLILTAIIFFIRLLFLSTKFQRGAIKIILLSSIIPLISNALYVSGYRPLSFIDLTPVAFSVSGLLFFYGIYSQKLLNVKPIALNTLFDNIPDGIIMVDNEFRIIDINRSALNMLDLGHEYLIGTFVQNILPYNLKVLSDVNSKESKTITFRGKYLDISHSQIRNDYGQRIGIIISIKDITLQYESEEKLKSATDRFELAVLAAGFDPWENNLATGERVGGMRIYRDLGYADNEIPSNIEGIFNLIHPDDIDDVKKSLQDHFDGETDIYTSDFRVRDKRGNYQWVANYARVIARDENGKALLFIGLTQNINDRKQVEERLKRKNEELIKANAEKDKFFSIIAHDLKGPFQGFIGLTEVMSEQIEEMSVNQMQEITKALQITAKNLYELLDNLLSWALVRRGHKRFNPEKIRIAPIVHLVYEMFLSQITLKGIKINNLINEDVITLADKESLKTILRNLISNAIKFTPEKGTITLSHTITNRGFVEITVSDTGIGMPESIKENLFKIDQKVSRPGTNQEPSTGLGLILCKELVEKHGGKIWVKSKEGEGSKFIFSLPTVG